LRLLSLLAFLAAALVVCHATTDDNVVDASKDEQRLERIEQMLNKLERKGRTTGTRFLDLGESQAPAAAAPAPAVTPSTAQNAAPPSAAPPVPTPVVGGRRSRRGIMGRLDSIESAIKELQRSQMSASQIAQAIAGTQSGQLRRTAAVESKSIMDFARDKANQIRQAVVTNDFLTRQSMIDGEIAKFPVQLQVAATRQGGGGRRRTALKDLTLIPEMMRA